VFMDPGAPGSCNPAWVLSTAKELCLAVAYLHSMDVVHGDLKSSNVLLKAAAATAADTRGFTAKVCGAAESQLLWQRYLEVGMTRMNSQGGGTAACHLPGLLIIRLRSSVTPLTEPPLVGCSGCCQVAVGQLVVMDMHVRAALSGCLITCAGAITAAVLQCCCRCLTLA
jgi:hypothetical protein